MSRDDDLPEFDTRPSIRLTNSAPEHPKIAELSDAAFRFWIESICYCSRAETDGRISRVVFRKIGPPRAARELIAAGLIVLQGHGYEVHDYLRHQRSAAEVRSFRESKSEAGALGAHKRWHVPQRRRAKDCPFCLQEVTGA